MPEKYHNQAITKVTKTLRSAYNEQYTDKMTEWREIGGKYKAVNILNVCKDYKFSKVLECGAGEGSILKYLDSHGLFSELFAVEISDTGVQQIKKRHLKRLKEVKLFDGYEIPYADGEFDMTYCSHVVEHVEHPRILLREIKRISSFQVFEIPLDYKIGMDENFKHYLSYGHINVYTPTMFKFLLKSEGYEIIDELLTHTDKEVIRFNWYKNMNLEKTIKREIMLQSLPLRNLLRRITRGSKRYTENGYSAYTCLAKSVGELRIF